MPLHVSTSAQLKSALLAAAPGDTILLAPGTYGKFSVNGTGKDWSGAPITIRSADPDNPATFAAAFSLNHMANVTVTDIAFTRPEMPPLFATAQVFVNYASNITMERIAFEGHIVAPGKGGNPRTVADSRDPIVGYGFGDGLQVTRVDGFTLRDSSFTDMRGAVLVRNSTDAVLEGLHIHGVREGINFTETTGMRIADSLFENFRAWIDMGDPKYNSRKHDHADMIQYWGVRNDIGVHDVVIENNMFRMPDGGATQTIFGHMRGAEPGVMASNFTVSGNVIFNGHPNAIRLGHVDGALIEHNILLPNGDGVSAGWAPRIQLTDTSRNAIVRDNAYIERSFRDFLDRTDADMIANNIVFGDYVPVSTDRGAVNYFGAADIAALRTTLDPTLGPVGLQPGRDAPVAPLPDTPAGPDTPPVPDAPAGSGLRLSGTAQDDTLTGRAGDDTILLRYGNDTATGGKGADTFVFDARYMKTGDAHTITDLDFAAGDALRFQMFRGAGSDTVRDAADLAALAAAQDWLTLDTSGADPVLILTGAGGARTTLRLGSDAPAVPDAPAVAGLRLSGGAGDNVLKGRAGDDTILLRYGSDTATGGKGADTFVFDARYMKTGDAHTITDLDFAAGDTLRFQMFRGAGSDTVRDAADLAALAAAQDWLDLAGSRVTLTGLDGQIATFDLL